jgi:hypothetical protein
VPAAATMLFEGAFANLHPHAATKVDLDDEERAPLRFIGFGEDHICPPKAVRHSREVPRLEDGRRVQGVPGSPAPPGTKVRMTSRNATESRR